MAPEAPTPLSVASPAHTAIPAFAGHGDAGVDAFRSTLPQDVVEDILSKQYDMVCYLKDGTYNVVIGEAERITRGSIFPSAREGDYLAYLEREVLPLVDPARDNPEELRRALSPDAVASALDEADSYTVDVTCLIGGEDFTKRFVFYAVDKDARFYILLKSDITDVLREQQARDEAQTLYEGMLAQFNAITDDCLGTTRCNLTTGLLEEAHGRDLFPTDHVGGSVRASMQAREDNFLIPGDRERFLSIFNPENLLGRTAKGAGVATFIAYSRRASGRQCFVKYSGSASKNPVTGEIIAISLETECSMELIGEVLNDRVLAQQYDMVSYIVGDHYEVVIGDASDIARGSIFPEARDGVYSDYLDRQVMPVVVGTDAEKAVIREALSVETVTRELETRSQYVVDLRCSIGGERFDKRFHYYAVGGRTPFFVLLKSDMTEVLSVERQRNEALADALHEAERANAAKTSFLSNMSHEIRTPLNAIIGLNSLALRDDTLTPQTRGYLEQIGSSARHLLGLINDILDMSRIESGKFVLKKEEFALRTMLDQICSMVRTQCEDKDLTFVCNVKGSLDDYYLGDDMKLKQVLINMLSNAIKFTEAPGTVTFEVERLTNFDNQSTLRFLVRDTGIGMEESFLEKLFEPFTQEDGSRSNKYGSTGLGMAIAKNIVEMMNGTIKVKSKKGVGTEFTVLVTLANVHHENALDIAVHPRDLRVLVIDDDEIACEHATMVLEEVGIRADSCISGEEALRLLEVQHAKLEPYNLLLVDWKMPEQDGVELTREIRRRYASETTVIILTGYDWQDVEEEARAAGVDSFLSKPLSAGGVIEEVERVARKKNAAFHRSRKQADLSGRRVLLAEDIAINAEIMKQVLAMKEILVDHAKNGREAVDMFAGSEPGHYDAVLMDVRMPVLDGLDATGEIRTLAREDARQVPIIALTANAFDEDVQRSLQVGMDAHLSKPVEPEVLYQTLGELIYHREAQ